MEETNKFLVTVEEPILVYPETFNSEHTLYLSPLDLQAPLFMYTLYFYKKDNIKSSTDIVFDALKEALQKVLVLYYPAAGRLRHNLETGKPEIECNNQGALLVRATTDARIEELGDPMNTDPELEKFVYKLRPTSGNPVIVTQVTACACGGIVIGFGSRHELFDAFSALQFLSAWGAVTRGTPLSEIPIPSHNRELLKPKQSELSLSQQSLLVMKKFDGIPLLTRADEKKSWEGTVTDFASLGIRPQYVMKVFRLTKEMLDYLKQKAMESGEIEKCSTFDVVTAHAWQARVQSLEMDPFEKVMLRFPVDGRTKIDPPLPPCFIGNVFIMASHACTVSDIRDSSLSSIVKRVQQAKADVKNSYIRNMINALAATQIKALPSFRETTIVTDWTRFPHHLLDFGWGGTIFATQVAMPLLDVIFLTSSSSKDEDLYVRLGLLPNYMEKFEQHFLQIQPETN
ncbi:hypothetical protein O6H91_18G059700 [Diphasiastrum complanatum]|uniref:Uncharacterized protein n=1 Tax=Diphasiastrum complanatum TaxID=34168 RepID=A0ACC2B1R4_DIPCM|nr:hypothetical protein O6H91_Y579200 [Diphasiastrum complanatum]KAJ7523716.1 hypothetical protein O6H91_18G059700 [Diphasiastrum complanatum]